MATKKVVIKKPIPVINERTIQEVRRDMQSVYRKPIHYSGRNYV